jgi:cell division protein FtsI (penicillin-binding protein 3)
VLAVRLPTWRSRVVLFVLFAAFAALAGRALWLQGLSTQFLQKQGEIRYARTIELPATRGKITDRDGQVLASSCPSKPSGRFLTTCRAGQAETAGQAAGHERRRTAKKLDSDRSFVYLKRQVEQDVADRSPSWASKASRPARNTSASTRRAK